MIRLVVAGAHTQILSPVCADCPHSPAGCCVGPPPLDWSDIGRVVALGGRDWLLAEIAAGRLVPCDSGLSIARAKGLSREGGRRLSKCVYHGPRGCTLSAERRSATCNYYVCDDALAGSPDAPRAREVHADLARRFEGWDAELAREIRDRFPEGPPYDVALLEWLGARFSSAAPPAAPSP